MAHRYPFSVVNPTEYYGRRVAVYYNLHYHVFSLKNGGKNGLLLSHAGSCELVDSKFEVEILGRERAIRQGRKNVHAYVIGTLQSLSWDSLTEEKVRSQINRGYQRVTYNLHPNHPQFYYKDILRYTPVTAAKSVIFTLDMALVLE